MFLLLANKIMYLNLNKNETYVCLFRFFISQSTFFSHVMTGLPGLNHY